MNRFLIWARVLAVLAMFLDASTGVASDGPNHQSALEQIKRNNPGYPGMELTDWVYINNGYWKDMSHFVVIASFKRTFRKKLSEVLKDATAGLSHDEADSVALNFVGLGFRYGGVKPGESFDEIGSFLFLKTEGGFVYQEALDTKTVARHLAAADTKADRLKSLGLEYAPACDVIWQKDGSPMIFVFTTKAEHLHLIVNAKTSEARDPLQEVTDDIQASLKRPPSPVEIPAGDRGAAFAISGDYALYLSAANSDNYGYIPVSSIEAPVCK